MSKTVILSAPKAWGKTRNAEALRQELGCASVVDAWDATQPLTLGALHLTNRSPQTFHSAMPALCTLVSRGWN